MQLSATLSACRRAARARRFVVLLALGCAALALAAAVGRGLLPEGAAWRGPLSALGADLLAWGFVPLAALALALRLRPRALAAPVRRERILLSAALWASYALALGAVDAGLGGPLAALRLPPSLALALGSGALVPLMCAGRGGAR